MCKNALTAVRPRSKLKCLMQRIGLQTSQALRARVGAITAASVDISVSWGKTPCNVSNWHYRGANELERIWKCTV
jgi:hypothetical protein